MLASAFLVAWAAEAAQFLISQGLALAILAWVQTLPEFAVEAVIAWEAGGDGAHCFVSCRPPGCHSHLAIANFTGAIRLLVGLAWPMIFFVAAFFGRDSGPFSPIHLLEDEHSVEVLTTVPPLLYFLWIWHKGSIDVDRCDGADRDVRRVSRHSLAHAAAAGGGGRATRRAWRAGRRRVRAGSACSRWAGCSRSAAR